MPGTSRAPAGVGHNHRNLTDEEMGALVTSFTTKPITAGRKRDIAATELKTAQKEVSGIFKLVAKETGYTRKEFEAEVIANLDKSEDELIADARRKLRLQRQAGLREGEQLDLVERINDTVDDAIAVEAAGYRAGRRGDDPTPMPDNINPIFAPDFQRGWVRGQEVNAKADAMAADILKRPKAGEMAADEEPEDEDDGEPEELDPEAEARKLKASGWADPTAEEQAFDDAAVH